LVNGDRNNTFFQRRANTRRKKKLVIKLHDDCVIWIDEQQAIADKFTTDFIKRYKSGHANPHSLSDIGLPKLVSEQENRELLRPPNLDKVQQALWSINSGKTLRPNGFGAGFFKNYWSTVKNDLFNCTLEIFTNGKLLKEINHTFIALIPKIENQSRRTNLDPLACVRRFIRSLPRY